MTPTEMLRNFQESLVKTTEDWAHSANVPLSVAAPAMVELVLCAVCGLAAMNARKGFSPPPDDVLPDLLAEILKQPRTIALRNPDGSFGMTSRFP